MPAELERARAFNLSRLNRIAAVEAGALETVDELISGFPNSYGSAERSCQQWVDITVADIQARPTLVDHSKLVAALQALRVRFDAIRLKRVIKIAEDSGDHESAQRCLTYLCFFGGEMSTRLRVAAMCLAGMRPESFVAPFLLATALGLSRSQTASSMAECRNVGFKILASIQSVEGELREASKPIEASPSDLEEEEHDEFMQSVLEDRAEYYGDGTPGSPLRFRRKQQRPGAVVMPAATTPPSTGRDDRGRVRKDFAGIAGKRLPFVLTGDVAKHMRALVERAPHLRELFHGMLTDTAMSPHVRNRPWLLVGEPGCGKTWAAQEYATVLGLPVLVFDAGSTSDSAFAGTPAQWTSAGACKAMQLINASGVPNPLVIVDEVDKAATSPHNGGLHNALLGFLEPGNSKNYHDPGLELTVDLSHVNYVLTANDLSKVPAPLRDRCRIVQVPNPGPQHVGTLVHRIVEDIAKQRGLDPRWEPPLDPDEIDIVAECWGGGSIRRLRQVVLSAVEFRSKNMGTC